MIFLADDAWYLSLGKGVVIFLALTAFFKIIKQSSWNCGTRIINITSNHREAKFFGLMKGISAVLINVVFLWLLIQGLAILVLGFVGVSPMQLVEWRFRELALIGTVVMTLVYSRIQKHQMNELG